MHTLLKLSRFIDRCTDWIGQLSNWIVLIVIAVGFYNVTARYIGRFISIKLSSNSLIELQWYLFSLIFFLGFAYILKHGINVRVDFLYSRWNTQQKAWVDLLGTVLFLIPFCVMGIVITINPVLLSWGRLPDGSWGNWEVSPDADGLPRAPIKSMILISFLTLLAQSLSQLIKYIAIVKGVPQVVDQVNAEAEEVHYE